MKHFGGFWPLKEGARGRQVAADALSPGLQVGRLKELTVDSSWGFAQLLEHIDIGVLVLDLERQTIDYHNPVFVEVISDPQLCFDYRSLYDLLLKDIEEAGHFEKNGYAACQVPLAGRILGCSIYKTSPRYRCFFIRDISEKVRLESIAQAVNAMDNIGFIFSGIRHEIGNPLNSLKMALSVLKQNLDNFSTETVNAYIDRGLADIGRMEYLLKSLKTFSMFEHVEIAEQPLAEFMDRFLALVEPDFEARGIRIVTDHSLDIAQVRIDKRALHQALLNIFNNAADALTGGSKPEIRVGAVLRGQLVWLTISDNGCGICPDLQKRLFQPFNTDKPSGNGLGLVITRKLLAMMNSDIDIESEPKKGTRVTISLPVARDATHSSRSDKKLS